MYLELFKNVCICGDIGGGSSSMSVKNRGTLRGRDSHGSGSGSGSRDTLVKGL